MTTAGELESDISPTLEIDALFMRVIESLAMTSIDNAKAHTDKVFEISSGFLDRDATAVLTHFKSLYWGDERVQQKKEEANRDVDDMIAKIKSNLDAGRDAAVGVEEREDMKTQRLALAGVQKKLEGLITLDKGIKDKVIPALSSMQFEDAVRQRVSHIIDGWMLTIKSFNSGNFRVDELAEKIGDMVSSVEEAEVYFRVVLDRAPPESGAFSGDALLF